MKCCINNTGGEGSVHSCHGDLCARLNLFYSFYLKTAAPGSWGVSVFYIFLVFYFLANACIVKNHGRRLLICHTWTLRMVTSIHDLKSYAFTFLYVEINELTRPAWSTVFGGGKTHPAALFTRFVLDIYIYISIYIWNIARTINLQSVQSLFGKVKRKLS